LVRLSVVRHEAKMSFLSTLIGSVEYFMSFEAHFKLKANFNYLLSIKK